MTTMSPPPGPLPVSLILVPVSAPAGMVISSRLPSTSTRRVVPWIRLVEGQLGGRLVAGGRRGPRWRVADGPAVDAHPGQDVLEAHAAGRPGAAAGRLTLAGTSGRSGHVLAEEHPEEVGELAGVAGRPEFVADVAARRPRAAEPERVAGTGRTAPPRLIDSQFAPSSSYCLRRAGSLRTSLASLTSLNRRSDSLSPGLASG